MDTLRRQSKKLKGLSDSFDDLIMIQKMKLLAGGRCSPNTLRYQLAILDDVQNRWDDSGDPLEQMGAHGEARRQLNFSPVGPIGCINMARGRVVCRGFHIFRESLLFTCLQW